MKKYIIYLIGCFLIGFVGGVLGISMFRSFGEFMTIIGLDLVLAIIMYHKEFFNFLKPKK